MIFLKMNQSTEVLKCGSLVFENLQLIRNFRNRICDDRRRNRVERARGAASFVVVYSVETFLLV